MYEPPIDPIRPDRPLSRSQLNRAVERLNDIADLSVSGGGTTSDEFGQQSINVPLEARIQVRILSGGTGGKYSAEHVTLDDDGTTWNATGTYEFDSDTYPAFERNAAAGVPTGTIVEAVLLDQPAGTCLFDFAASEFTALLTGMAPGESPSGVTSRIYQYVKLVSNDAGGWYTQGGLLGGAISSAGNDGSAYEQNDKAAPLGVVVRMRKEGDRLKFGYTEETIQAEITDNTTLSRTTEDALNTAAILYSWEEREWQDLRPGVRLNVPTVTNARSGTTNAINVYGNVPFDFDLGTPSLPVGEQRTEQAVPLGRLVQLRKAPAMVNLDGFLSPSTDIVPYVVAEKNAAVTGRHDVTIQGISGAFRLKLLETWTAAITYSDDGSTLANAVESALQALTTDYTVTVTFLVSIYPGTHAKVLLVEFDDATTGDPADLDEMLGDYANLVGKEYWWFTEPLPKTKAGSLDDEGRLLAGDAETILLNGGTITGVATLPTKGRRLKVLGSRGAIDWGNTGVGVISPTGDYELGIIAGTSTWNIEYLRQGYAADAPVVGDTNGARYGLLVSKPGFVLVPAPPNTGGPFTLTSTDGVMSWS